MSTRLTAHLAKLEYGKSTPIAAPESTYVRLCPGRNERTLHATDGFGIDRRQSPREPV